MQIPASDSLREIAMIADLGVEFRFGVYDENEDDLAALEKAYDAIFVGIGLGAMNQLRIPVPECVPTSSTRSNSSRNTRPRVI